MFGMSDGRAKIQVEIAKLKDASPRVRKQAAQVIRDILKEEPEAAGDPGEAFWKEKFSDVIPGMTPAAIRRVTGATEDGADVGGIACGGGSCAIQIRLDDYWVAAMSIADESGGLIGPVGFSRLPRSYWVEPPKDYSGSWRTFFLNGGPRHEMEYSNGRSTRIRSFLDNGQLGYEQGDDVFSGKKPEIGFYRNGSKMYEGRYSDGKREGTWTHWFPNGSKQSEARYIGGQLSGQIGWHQNGQKSREMEFDGRGIETGQAAWREDGTLQFAHGSLSEKYGPK
jgi:hypothetical protein